MDTKAQKVALDQALALCDALSADLERLGVRSAFATDCTSAGQILALHMALTAEDLRTTAVAHVAGSQFASLNPQGFDAAVENARPLARAPDLAYGTAFPLEEIQRTTDSVSRILGPVGAGVRLETYIVGPGTFTLSCHIARSKDAAFASHVALLTGLMLRDADPEGFAAAAASYRAEQPPHTRNSSPRG